MKLRPSTGQIWAGFTCVLARVYFQLKGPSLGLGPTQSHSKALIYESANLKVKL